MTGPIDPKVFRKHLGQFPTGVSVVATDVGGEVHGMTAGSITSLSLNPLLMIFCVDKRAKMAEILERARGFSINVLREDQQALSTYFAGGWKQSQAPPFRFVPWDGGPRLEGCAAAIGCRLHQTLEGGDHWIVLGEVIALHMGIEPLHPLVFHGGMYRKLDYRESQPAPDLDVSDTPAHVFYDPWDAE